MIRAWDAGSRAMKAASDAPATGWLHVTNPAANELDALAATGLSREFLLHALDPNELPRLDRDASASLVIIRVPVRGTPGELPFRTSPLGVIATRDRLVTISRDELDVHDFAPAEGLDAQRPLKAVLRLLERTAARFLTHLHELETEVDQLEDQLQQSLRNAEVLQLLRHQKALVHFTTGLSGNELVLGRLRRDQHFPVGPGDDELLDDVAVEVRQAIEVTRISQDILSQMMDAFASIISNNLNVVMKVLTSLTILLAIPTVVASFYGMNVGLPLQQHPAAFVVLVAGSALLSAALAVFFYRRRWL
ncbi:MAG: magnesium transporter CorA family protein [Myxococcaceae bacterium]|nr:magnesium transporter CorA family protein [Myxococcaceae bacterium]